MATAEGMTPVEVSSMGSRTSTRIRFFWGFWEGEVGESVGREALIYCQLTLYSVDGFDMDQ